MLVQEVAQEFGGVDFVVENFGESELADRFGVERYPAVFVEDVLIARPKDFGFYGETGSQGEGRYTPWLEQASHERFSADVRRAVHAALAGDDDGLKEYEVEADLTVDLSRLPPFEAEDLEGRPVTSEGLQGRVVIVDFWATWCPPCVKSLPWLADVQRRYEGELTVLGIAIESPPAELERMVEEHQLPFPVIAGGADLARTFGDVLAVPTLFVFDRDGLLQRTAYGAPPELAGEIDALLDEWIDRDAPAAERPGG